MTNIKKETAVNFNEALRIVINPTRRLGIERVDIYDNCALNRILAEDIIADNDHPPVNKSGHINAFCETDGLLYIPAGVTEITKGAIVNIRLI